MADFNLSASVGLQLAPGAVKKLIDDANAQFSALQITPKVDDKKLEGELKETAKKAKRAVQKFDIPFNFTFDTTRAKLEAQLLSKPFKVKIELADGEQEKFRRQLAGLFDITRKGMKLLFAETNASVEKTANKVKKAKEAKGKPVDEVIGATNLQTITKLTQAQESLTLAEEKAKNAVNSYNNEVKRIINTIDDLAAAEKKAGKGGGSLYTTLKNIVDQIAKIDGTISDDFIKNFEQMLAPDAAKVFARNITSVGLALHDLNIQASKLDDLQKLNKNFDLSEARGEIEDAYNALLKLLSRSEFKEARAVSKAISYNISAVKSSVRQATTEINGQIKALQSLEDILTGRVTVAKGSLSGKSKEQAKFDIQTAKDQLTLFKELKKAGNSLEDIKIQLKISDNDITALERANGKVEEFKRKAKAFQQSLVIGSFDQTEGFKALDIAKKAAQITSETIAQLEEARNSGANLDDLGLIGTAGKDRLNQLRKDAGELNRVFTDLEKLKIKFDLEGLVSARDATARLIEDLRSGKVAIEDFNKTKLAINQEKEKINFLAYDEKGAQKLPELLANITSLSQAQDRLNTALNKGSNNSFFQFAAKKIQEIQNNAQAANVSLKYLFEGSNSNPAENLSRALNVLYKETVRLGTLRSNASAILDNATRNTIINNINAVEKEMNDLLLSFDISNSGAFSAKIRAMTGPLSTQLTNALRESTRNVEDLDKAINKLSAQKVSIVGLNPTNAKQQVDVLNELIKLLNDFKQSGKSFASFNQDDTVVSLQNLLSSLEKSGQVVDTIYNKFQKLKSILSSRFANQDIPKALGIDQRAQDIIDKYNASVAAIASNVNLSSRDRAGAIQINEATGREEISRLAIEANDLANQLEKLRDTELQLDASGLSDTSQSVRDLRNQILSTLNITSKLPDVSRSISDGLIKISQGADSEKKLQRYITTIDRLRATLVSLDGEDLSNVSGKLDDLEKQLIDLSRAGAGDREIKNALSKGTFDVRQAQKFNNVVAETSEKLEYLAIQQKVPKAAEAFRQANVEFNRFAQDLVSSSKPALQKLNELETKTKVIIALARIKADGGFFDSFAKAAGLAAKRLGAFLGLAQGLYGIQSVIVDSIRTAVQLDKEFIKLQQVFSTDLSGNALSDQVEETSSQILSLAKNYGVATDQVAEGAKIFAQAGIAGKDLSKILEVVAKTELGPSFENVGETAEATIAFMNQFGISANNVEEALGGVSRVSAKYPVEAGGITAAIRRAGSTFDATGDSLANFVAAFTVVKTATREADETIATALRNIASRIQRAQTQEYLKEAFGINLLNDAGLFVGFNKSIELIGKKIEDLGINSADPRFSELLDKLAGQRQAGKLKPLIENFSDLEKIVKEYGKGADSINSDVAAALEGIENKLLRAKAAVVELFTELGRSAVVKTLVDVFTNLTTALTGVLRAFNGVAGAAALAFGTMKALPAITSAAQFGVAEFLPHFFQKKIYRNKGGKADTSGYIPGGGPNVDSILAYLTRGEFVLRRSAVKKYGLDFLNNLNEGKVTHANSGGPIGFNSGGLIPGFMVGGLNDKSTGLKSLQQLAAKAGVVISKKLLEAMVDTFKVLPLGVNFGGVFKPDKKELGYRPDQSLKKVVHELGHALDKVLPKNFEDKFSPEYIAKTQKVVDARPDLYGEKGSKKYNKNLKKEVRANILKDINESKKTGIPASYNPDDQLLLKDAEARYNQAGVRFRDPNETQRKKEAGLQATAAKREKIINDTLYDKNTARQLRQKRVLANKSNPISSKDFGVVNGVFKGLDIQLKTFNNTTNQTTNLFKKLHTPLTAAIIGLGLFGDRLLGTDSALRDLTTILIGAASQLAILKSAQAYLGKDTLGKIKNAGGFVPKGASGPASLLTNGQQSPKIFKEEYLKRTSGFLNTGTDAKQVALEIAARKKEAHYSKPENLQRAKNRSFGLADYKKPQESKIVKSITEPFKKIGRSEGFTRLLKTPGGKIAGKVGQGLLGVGKSVKSVVGGSKGNVFALAGLAASEALSYFANKAIESADATFAAATNEADALEALTKKRRAETVKGALKKGGSIISGAAAGAVLGIPGAIVGAIVGGIYAFLPEISKKIKSLFGVDILGFFTYISDTIKPYYQVASEYVGKFIDGIGYVFALLSGTLEERAKQQAQDLISARRISTVNKAKREVKSGGGSVLFNQDNAGVIGSIVKTGNQAIADKNGFDNLPQDQKDKLKTEAEALKQLLESNDISAKDKIQFFKSMEDAGVDIEKFFKNVGVSFDKVTPEVDVAADKLSLLFARIQDTVDKSNARLSGIEGGIDFISNKGSQSFVPDQIFDIIKQGFNPRDLGFNNIMGNLEPLMNQAKGFDKNFAEALDFEMKGLGVSRKVQSAFANTTDLKLETKGSTPQEALEAFLEDSFKGVNKSSGGPQELDTLFTEFLTANQEEVAKAIDSSSGGQVAVKMSKVTDLMKNFAESLDKGSIEAFKRMNEANKKFAQEYQNLLSQRIEIEQNALKFRLDNISVAGEQDAFVNQAQNLTGDKLLAAQKSQAENRTNDYLNEQLAGTGLNAGSSVDQMGNAIKAAQRRLDNARAMAEVELIQGGNKSPSALDITQRTGQIESKAQSDITNLSSSLQYVANGTDKFKYSLEAFNKAAEKAAKSSEFLTNNLLGTDDQLMQTVRGLQLEGKLKTLKPEDRMSYISTLNQQDRQALQSSVSQRGDEEMKKFQESIGISSNILASKEAQDVIAGFKDRKQSNVKLAESEEGKLPDLNKQIEDLRTFYQQQFDGTNQTINMFNQAVNKVAETIAQVPTVINHTMKVDGVVNIVGGDFLAKSTEALKAAIDAEIAKQLQMYDAKLRESNSGLNTGVAAAITNAPPIADVMF